jgi:hypothetical protein
MAERHRAIAARDKERELQEVFGCSFHQLLVILPAGVLLQAGRKLGCRRPAFSLKALTPQQRTELEQSLLKTWEEPFPETRQAICNILLNYRAPIEKALAIQAEAELKKRQQQRTWA